MLYVRQCKSIMSGRVIRSVQHGHEHGKPQLLCAEQRVCIGPPLPTLDIVDVSKNCETPCSLAMISPTWVGDRCRVSLLLGQSIQ